MLKIVGVLVDGVRDCSADGRPLVTADTLPQALSPAAVTAVAGRLVDNVSEFVRGQSGAVRLLTAAFLSGGHVLIEDAPFVYPALRAPVRGWTVSPDFAGTATGV